MKFTIISTTDGKYIGDVIDTDLKETIFPSGEHFSIDNRMRLLNGTWKIWNSNYVIEIAEMEE